MLFNALWFFLPAGVANMVPVFVAKLPWLRDWNTPLDFNNTFQNNPIFGKNKTWRGLILGTLAAGLVGLLQYKVITHTDAPALFIFIATAAMGYGALIGDAIASFFKRRRGVKPGSSWFPIDQIDYIIGGLLVVYPFVRLSLEFMLTIFVLYFCLHVITSYIGYLIGVKSRPI